MRNLVTALTYSGSDSHSLAASLIESEEDKVVARFSKKNGRSFACHHGQMAVEFEKKNCMFMMKM